MKLFYAPASPYARKVLACAITREIEGRIDKLICNPNESPAELLAGANQSCAIKRRGFAIRSAGYDLREREGWRRGRPNSPASRR